MVQNRYGHTGAFFIFLVQRPSNNISSSKTSKTSHLKAFRISAYLVTTIAPCQSNGLFDALNERIWEWPAVIWFSKIKPDAMAR
jgi:hypothetical protein